MAHHGIASWGVVAASARCKALILLGFLEICSMGYKASWHSMSKITNAIKIYWLGVNSRFDYRSRTTPAA